MPDRLRFHLDEQVSHDIERALRNRGIDVTTAADAQLLGASDDAHLAFAANAQRVVVTHNADFLRHADLGTSHYGIAYCAQGQRSTGEIVRQLCLMHDCLEAAEMVNAIEYL